MNSLPVDSYRNFKEKNASWQEFRETCILYYFSIVRYDLSVSMRSRAPSFYTIVHEMRSGKLVSSAVTCEWTSGYTERNQLVSLHSSVIDTIFLIFIVRAISYI
jgi:hypothetical protein